MFHVFKPVWLMFIYDGVELNSIEDYLMYQTREITRQEKVIIELQESTAEILELIRELGCELDDIEEDEELPGD